MNNKIIYKAFKTRIYPTKEQIIYFKKCFGISRFAYNWYINKKQEYYLLGMKKSYYDLRKEFNSIKEIKFPFVLDINYQIYICAIDNANNAYKMFFTKANKYPKYKSKKNKNQKFSSNRCKIINNNNFYMANNGSKKANQYNYLNCGYIIKSAEDISFLQNKQIILMTISYDNLNYYVSFNYKEYQNELYNNHKYNIVGIDLGLKTFAVQSDGKISKLPKQKIIKIEKRIKKLNQIMSKKEYNSNNYNKVKTKLNKCYKKITNIQNDFLNKYTTWLCKNYKIIKIEDLNIMSMLKNKKLAKSISRSNFYKFRNMLLYKSVYYNNEIILVDRYFASSKICNNCGHKKEKLKLSERIYVCEKCGYIEDRDLNAAFNIRDWNK